MGTASGRLVAVVLALAGVVGAHGARQVPPPTSMPLPRFPGPLQQPPVFRIHVDLIQVDVSVLDRDRRPVRGLTAADFAVLEDGKPQQISAFVEMSASDPDAPPGTWRRTVPPDVTVNNAEDGRVLLLILDDGRMPFMPAARRGKPIGPDPEIATRQVARAIIERLGPADLAAVIFTARNRNEQEFTGDRNRLFAAIENFDTMAENLFSTRRALNTFKQAAELLAEIPNRRKAIILIGPGTPGAYVPGSRVVLDGGAFDIQDALVAAVRGNVTFYTINPMMMSDLDPEVERLLDPPSGATAAGGSAASFTRPTSGPPPPPTYTKDTRPLPLDQLTGGFTVRGPGQLAEGIQQIFRETGSYYLLGYTNSGPKDDGRTRRIEVKVNRPELVVRSRTTYVPVRAANASRPVAPNWNAISGLLPAKDIPMRLNVTTFAIPGKKEVALAIVLGLREPLPLSATAPVAEIVQCLAQAFSANGDRRGPPLEMTVKLQLHPNPRGEVKYEVLSLLKLKPGRYHLRLSATSRLQARSGSIYYDLEVPDYSKTPLALSGVVLSASPALVAGPTGVLAPIIPVVPTTQREFQGHRGQAFIRVYQGGKGRMAPVAMAVRIIDTSETAVFSRDDVLSTDRFDSNRAAEYRFDLPVAQLPPGRYLLRFEAMTPGAPAARQDVQFVVREPIGG